MSIRSMTSNVFFVVFILSLFGGISGGLLVLFFRQITQLNVEQEVLAVHTLRASLQPSFVPFIPLFRTEQQSVPSLTDVSGSIGDGCYHVYIDIGTNVAVQFHKLWDPSIFPDGGDPWGNMFRQALVLPIFDKYFGPGGRHDVCGFGFEPNPHHAELLRQTVVHYRTEGQRLTIYEAGGGDFDGLGVVVHDNDIANNEWSTRIVPVPDGQPPPPGAIPLIDIKKWLSTNILNRRIPSERHVRPPAIVMKIDAEDSEVLLLSGLLSTGGLCNIDFVYVDSLPDDYMTELQKNLTALACTTVVVRLDDEAFHTYRPPWLVNAENA